MFGAALKAAGLHENESFEACAEWTMSGTEAEWAWRRWQAAQKLAVRLGVEPESLLNIRWRLKMDVYRGCYLEAVN